MKTIIQIATCLVFATMALQGTAQSSMTVCANSNAIVTAVNGAGLSNPTYSLEPGSVVSSNPAFAVSPASSVIYTLYTTGTNSNSAVVTTSNTVNVQVYGVSYSITSTNNFSLGCGANSVCAISIINANTFPISGGAVSYTFLSSGNPTTLPAGPLGFTNVINITSPGTWSAVVRNNGNGCTAWTPVTIIPNAMAPGIGSISISQSTISCANPTAMIQAAPSASVQYNWYSNTYPLGTPGNSLVVGANTAIPTQSVAATITLVVTDNTNACTSNTAITIYQNIYTPSALTGPLPPGICSNTFILTNTSTSGIPFGTFPVTLPVVAQLWEGPSPQVTGSLSSTYLAQTSGVYTMTVMDMNNGCIASTTVNVNLGPVAAFVHTITAGTAVFNDASTGTGTNTAYYWDFGDGSSSTAQNPTHTYTNAGSHLVKLKITDLNVFCSDSVIQSINVSGVPCTANSNFSMVPTATSQVWNVVPSYPWNVASATWSWGDGSTSNTLYASHQYSAAGMYNICLSVTVSCVASSSTCTSYSVYRASQSAMIVAVNVVSPDIVSGIASNKINEELLWNIVPNPNAGEFYLNLDNVAAEPVHVSIRDLTGRLVHEQTLAASSNAIHTGGLPAGLYLVTMQTKQLKATKRMVIIH